jgi:hypothetical protein
VADLLVDTDVCIDHLRGAKRLPRASRLGYSVITRAEPLAGASLEDETYVRTAPSRDGRATSRPASSRQGGPAPAETPPLTNGGGPNCGNCVGSLAHTAHQEHPRTQTGSRAETAVALGVSGWVIKRDPRPWVKKLNDQRSRTSNRFSNPIR